MGCYLVVTKAAVFFFFFFFFGLAGELSLQKVSGSAAKVPSNIVKELETAKY